MCIDVYSMCVEIVLLLKPQNPVEKIGRGRLFLGAEGAAEAAGAGGGSRPVGVPSIGNPVNQEMSKWRKFIPWFFVFVGTRFRMWNPSWLVEKSDEFSLIHPSMWYCSWFRNPKQPPGMVLKPCKYWFVQLPFPQLFWTPEKSLKKSTIIYDGVWMHHPNGAPGWDWRIGFGTIPTARQSGKPNCDRETGGNASIGRYHRITPKIGGRCSPTHFEKHPCFDWVGSTTN